MNNGQWKLSSVSPALVVSSGLVFLKDKKPKGLYLDDILEMIKEHSDRNAYCKVIPRRMTLAEAIEYNEFSKLGVMRNTYSCIDLSLLEINLERVFEDLPRTGRQLLSRKYRSKPARVGEQK